MISKNTSIEISEIKNHYSRLASHVIVNERQLSEIIELRNERYGALLEIVRAFEKFVEKEIPDSIPEKIIWQETIAAAKDSL